MTPAARLAWGFLAAIAFAGLGALVGVILVAFVAIAIGAFGLAPMAAQILLIAGAALGALAGLVILARL